MKPTETVIQHARRFYTKNTFTTYQLAHPDF